MHFIYFVRGLTVIPSASLAKPSLTTFSLALRPSKTSRLPSFLIPVTTSVFLILLLSIIDNSSKMIYLRIIFGPVAQLVRAVHS